MRKELLEVLDICRSVFEVSGVFYDRFAKSVEEPGEGEFWEAMAAEHRDQMDRWNELYTLAEFGMVPELLENVTEVKRDLRGTLNEAVKLFKRHQQRPDTVAAFTAAGNITLQMTGTATLRLISYYNEHFGPENPWDYGAYLEFLLTGMQHFGGRGPELASLATAIRRIDREASASVAQDVTDPLTGLRNRASFERGMTGVLHSAKREGQRVALLLIGLDGVESFNRQFGDAAGDELLKKIAAELRKRAQPSDLVARYGGVAFAIGLRDVFVGALPEIADNLHQPIRALLAENEFVKQALGGSHMLVTGDVTASWDELRRKAEHNMHRARDERSDSVVM
ncbi:MAG: GGDEF domain-containing protein [Candidatus Lernaella stagnicola]|nr:GGDEF domain-containing protein [Candidatus Lernaella stagnicola]